MNTWIALLALALVQGVTEFLPVSSSGHLALGQKLLGVGEGSVLEEIVLHVGTLLAVIFFYRADLLKLLRGALARDRNALRYMGLLLLANIPAGFIGLLFRHSIEPLFDRMDAVLLALAVTGLVLWSTRNLVRGERQVGVVAAVAMGLAQAVAILPGCSRSGWTLAVALHMGMAPAEAARFSFLMSLPAIAGATLLQFSDLQGTSPEWGPLALGLVASAFVGWLALGWLVKLVAGMALHRFAWYLWALAVVGGSLLFFG